MRHIGEPFYTVNTDKNAKHVSMAQIYSIPNADTSTNSETNMQFFIYQSVISNVFFYSLYKMLFLTIIHYTYGLIMHF